MIAFRVLRRRTYLLLIGVAILTVVLNASANAASNSAKRLQPRYARPEAAPRERSGATVTRDGTALMRRGKPYHFVGLNVYMAASGGTCGGKLYPDVGGPLSNVPRGSVIRFWAFQNFFVVNGRFDWTNLDRVIAIAAAHGDRVIPVLANQYDYCERSAKNLSWYQGGYQNEIPPGDFVTYEQYVAAVVTRYAGNPTIAMWQLVNEGEAVSPDGSCDEPAAFDALLTFAGGIGGLVHHLDPKHLVSLGTLAGYSGSGHQWCGAADGDYQKLMASPGNDVCDYHDYGYPNSRMGRPLRPNLITATRMCRADHKPIMVAETGIYAKTNAQLRSRSAKFRRKFVAQFRAGVVGELMWAWAVKPQYRGSTSDSNYSVFPGDPSLAVLSSFVG